MLSSKRDYYLDQFSKLDHPMKSPLNQIQAVSHSGAKRFLSTERANVYITSHLNVEIDIIQLNVDANRGSGPSQRCVVVFRSTAVFVICVTVTCSRPWPV